MAASGHAPEGLVMAVTRSVESGSPAGVTLVHVAPPSFVTCTRPSFVPAQMTPRSSGDSAIEKTTPAYSTERLSTVRPPESPIMLRSLSVRSGLIARQVLPRSSLRNKRLVPK